jgi:hypothetical protein
LWFGRCGTDTPKRAATADPTRTAFGVSANAMDGKLKEQIRQRRRFRALRVPFNR